ncbi:unnamed protein product, partial [Ectocarpus sp. 4 AP-2014]
MPFTTMATRARDNLLDSSGCRQCSTEVGELGPAAIALLRMVDIWLDRDVIFQDIKARFVTMEG